MKANSKTNSTLALAVLAALCILGLWLLLRITGQSARPDFAKPVRSDRAPAELRATPSELTPSSDLAREVAESEYQLPAPAPTPEETQAILILVLRQDDDRPIAGARVTVYDDETEGGAMQSMPVESETGASGRCVLLVADSAKSVRLRVEKQGFFHVNANYQCLPELTLRLSPTSTLFGRVLAADTDAPVPGARIRHLHYDCRECKPDLTIADAQGNYELHGVARLRTTTFQLEADGFAMQYRTLEIREDGASVGLDFRLERGFEVAGRVVDFTSGVGLPDAKVGEAIRTDASGAFRGRVVRQEGEAAIDLRVQAEGHCSLSASLGQGPAPDPFEFRLPRGAIVEGTVKNDRGIPIPAARVQLEKDYRAQALPELKPEPSPLELPEGWSLAPEGYHCETRTDEQGRFSIRNAVPWNAGMKISVVADGHARATQTIERVPGPDQSTRVEFVLVGTQPEVTLRGEIWINGQNYSGAQGRVRWKGPSRQGEQEIYSGRFAANVEPGEIVLNVEVDELSAALDGLESRLHVHPRKTLDHVVDIQLATRPITGRVTFADGAVAPRVSMEARLDIGGSDEDYRNSLHVSARTEKDGTYALDVPDLSGSYRVVASLDEDERSVDGIRAGAGGVDLVLARGGLLMFRLRDARSDKTLPGHGFELGWKRSAEEQYRSVEMGWPLAPDQDGWFEIRLPGGRVDLRASDPMRAEFASAYVEDVLIQPHEPSRLELVMLPGQSVELVRAAGEDPLPGGHTILLIEAELWDDVQHGPDRGSWDGGKLGEAILNRYVQFAKDGRATVRGLGRGRYRFKVFPDDLDLEPAEVQLGDKPSEPVLVRWRKR